MSKTKKLKLKHLSAEESCARLTSENQMMEVEIKYLKEIFEKAVDLYEKAFDVSLYFMPSYYDRRKIYEESGKCALAYLKSLRGREVSRLYHPPHKESLKGPPLVGSECQRGVPFKRAAQKVFPNFF